MSPEAQQIAIAEACGWIKFWEPHRTDEGVGQWMWHKGKQNLRHLSDYLKDLNAMHETVQSEKAKQFGSEFYSEYCEILQDICGGVDDAINATAAQRAEAFLKAKGLWRDV